MTGLPINNLIDRIHSLFRNGTAFSLFFLLFISVSAGFTQVFPVVESMVKEADDYKNNDPKKAIQITESALEMARKSKHSPSLARVHRYIGVLYFMTGELVKARHHFDSSYVLYLKLGDEKGIAACQNNIGVIYQEVGEYNKAIDFF